MTTALNLITRAMQKAGILFKSETPDADEAQDALDELNQMLGEWSNDSMLISARTRESFPSTGAVSYTIGSGGDFDTVRPTDIISIFARQGTTDYPLSPITDENYALISQKSTPGTPEFYNYSNAYPLATLSFYPAPVGSYTIHIYSNKPLTQYASLSTDVDLPPGWKIAIINNLAVRLCPEFGQQASPELVKLAFMTLASIKRSIMKARSKDAYPQMVQNFNIYSGYNL